MPVAASFLAVYLAILALTRREESLEEKLRRFTAWRTPSSPVPGKKNLKYFLSKAAQITPNSWSVGLDKQLLRGDIPLKGGEFLVLQGLLSILSMSLGVILINQFITSFVLAIIGGFSPRIWLMMAQKRKLKTFNNQLSDSLLILANSLRAGFSLLQAMEMVSQEMSNPISAEFRLTLKEMTYGASTETALTHLAERVGSEDLDLLVTAIMIQRQVGGNLAEVLQNIQATIQDRIRIQQEIKTLTAQGRISGYIIAGLPFGIAGVLSVINPSYLTVLVTKPLGVGLLAGGITLQVVGFLIIRKLITIHS